MANKGPGCGQVPRIERRSTFNCNNTVDSKEAGTLSKAAVMTLKDKNP